MGTPISYSFFKELKSIAAANSVKSVSGDGAVTIKSFSLSDEQPIFKIFQKDEKLESMFNNNDSYIIEGKSGISIYPNLTVKPKEHYSGPAHYYHDAMRQYCSYQVKHDAELSITNLREKYTEAYGELPTVANLNKSMISGLKQDSLKMDINDMQQLLVQEYKDVIKSEISAVAVMNAKGYNLDDLSLNVAASNIMKAERALERNGVQMQTVYECLNTFKNSDRTIARLTENDNHYIANMAKENVKSKSNEWSI